MESGNHPESHITHLNQPTTAPSDLRVLRNLLLLSMAGLLLVSLSFMYFMYQQRKIVRTQLAEQRPAVMKAIYDYNQTSLPVIRRFGSRVREYAATHPDFRPILQKYEPILGDLLTGSTNSPVAPVTAPSPSASPKK